MTDDQMGTAPAPSAERPMGLAEQRRALARLGLGVAALVVLAALTGKLTLVAVIFIFVAVIMLHELGHFATAKWSGLKVSEYFLGFGPRLWSVKRGETEYGVKAIPAGGYVKILGMTNLEEVDPADEARTYRSAHFGRRLLVISAGSLMHMLIALVVAWVVLSPLGTINDSSTQPVVGSISALATGQSPAQAAGFRVGDRVVAVDGHRVRSWNDVPPLIRARPGEATSIDVLRHGSLVHLQATPVDESTVSVTGAGAPVPTTHHVGFLGIGQALPVVHENPVGAVGTAVKGIGSTIAAEVGGLGHSLSIHGLANYARLVEGHGHTAATPQSATANQNRFVSIVGVVQLSTDAAHSGIRNLLALLVTFNVFLGVFNMVPLLPLDGGHFVVAIYERLRSRRGLRYRVDIRKLLPATYLVFMLIIVLGVTSVYLDIAHPVANPFQ